MILELKIKNYLSFKDEVVYSFEATADKTLEERYVVEVAPGVRILKLGIVYGANASGKSNLIEAFNFIRNFARYTVKDKTENTGFVPFMFDKTKDEPGRFELTFYIDGTKHSYFLAVDENYVFEEKLFYYPGTQPALIFNRYFDKENSISTIEFGSKIKVSKAAKDEFQIKTLKNMSFLAASLQVNFTIPELEKVLIWFQNQFFPPISPDTSLSEYSKTFINKDAKAKKFAVKFMKDADYNITDILVEDIVHDAPENLLKFVELNLTDKDEKERILKEKTIHLHKLAFEHEIERNGKKEKHILSENFQSDGTMRYFGLSGPIYETLKNNAFLSIDEIESSLHALLVNHLIREFLMAGDQSKHAQLLVTTHNIALLAEKELLRKDAIWFVDKVADGHTTLYSMADFDMRKELSFYKAYKIGKFGAIPNIE
jgi:AAA15 family ATPase/GTPase